MAAKASTARHWNHTKRKKKSFLTATKQKNIRDYGYAILATDKYETNCEVVFGEKNDSILLGVRTIEGFGVKIDNINGRFEPIQQLVTGITLVHEGENFEYE